MSLAFGAHMFSDTPGPDEASEAEAHGEEVGGDDWGSGLKVAQVARHHVQYIIKY